MVAALEGIVGWVGQWVCGIGCQCGFLCVYVYTQMAKKKMWKSEGNPVCGVASERKKCQQHASVVALVSTVFFSFVLSHEVCVFAQRLLHTQQSTYLAPANGWDLLIKPQN